MPYLSGSFNSLVSNFAAGEVLVLIGEESEEGGGEEVEEKED